MTVSLFRSLITLHVAAQLGSADVQSLSSARLYTDVRNTSLNGYKSPMYIDRDLSYVGVCSTHVTNRLKAHSDSDLVVLI